MKVINSIRTIAVGVAAFIIICAVLATESTVVRAASCSMPGTDHGVITTTTSITSAGNYRIWTRMASPNTTDNTFLLEVDGTACFNVGGSSVPVYANGSTTHFANGKANWVGTAAGGGAIDVSLTPGSHTLKLIGISDGVVVDRVIVTADTSCVPINYGDNCASIYIAADINQDSRVDLIDFSMLADKYSQAGGSLGRSDINNDGAVDFLDYSILANRYGE